MKRAVIFNPKTTIAVKRIAPLGPRLKKELRDDAKVTLLRGVRAGQIAAARKLAFRDRSKTMVVYIGHGHDNNWVGEYSIVNALDPAKVLPNELLTSGWNDGLLKDTIAVAIACDTGVELATSAMMGQCKAYIGSEGSIYVGQDHKEYPYGTRILETYLAMVLALRDGSTVHEAVETFAQQSNQLADEIGGKSLVRASHYTRLAAMNADAMRYWGDGKARWL